MDDQGETVAFLSKGASYGRPDIAVERIGTHISLVFLVDGLAYKLKRAVRFSYLDYSTVALRERYCREELALNRRTAPALYRGLRAITREADGRLVFDGKGIAVDWVLEMRRFSQGDLFDRLAEAGKLTPLMMRELTDAIAVFHRDAEVTAAHGGQAGTAQTVADNNLNLVAACPPLDRSLADSLYATSVAKLSAIGPLLEVRRLNGKVRRCHGDLHLRNICLVDGRPTLFDGIEFNDSLACIDVLYDLAFLLMDLEHRGLHDLACIVFNRYLDIAGESEGLPALPLFMSMRAAVRAHVLAAQARENPTTSIADEARSYLKLAGRILEPQSPRLIAIGGLSGTGKSTVAQGLASDFAPAPGARIVRSDVLRKRLFDLTPETRLSPAAYSEATTERVYRGLRDQAAGALAAGYSTLVDATFLRKEERQAIAAVAEEAGVHFLGFWLDAAPQVLAARLEARRGDASDANTAVLRKQLDLAPGNICWHRIDSTPGPAAVLDAIRRIVAGTRR